MSRLRISMVILGCSLGLAWQGSAAHAQGAQGAYGQQARNVPPAFRAPGSYQRVSGRSNPALTFFGGGRAMQYSAGNTQQMPAPAPVQTAAYNKPYSNLQQQPSVSPYLALDQFETAAGVPNYYMYVKPQLDQSRMNQAQQVQNRRMQNQMRRATTAGVMPRGTSGGMPTTGQSLQFMNSGGYYPGR